MFWAVVAAAPAQAQVTTTAEVASTGQCMDVFNFGTTNGTAVVQWGCTGANNQKWQLTQSSTPGYFSLKSVHSGLCLDVSAWSTSPGTALHQWSCYGGDNQLFSLKWQRGAFSLVARHSGLCVGIETTDAGARLTQQTCNGGTNQTWRFPALPANARSGSWGPVQNLSLVPAAAANLPDGKVLMWSAYDRFRFGGDNGRTYTLTFDPASGTYSEVLVSNTGHDMFCPGIANLPDGTIHVTGGSSSAMTSIYNPATNTWIAAAPMNQPRGYQSAVTLSTGDVFTIGGSWSGGRGNKHGEVWQASSNTWRSTGALLDNYILTADKEGLYRANNHAWLFAASDGRVFHAGPSRRMNWFDTSGNGTVTNAGTRGNDGDAMNGNAVMYDIDRILTIGGAPHYDNVAATRNAHVINISSSTVSVKAVASMAYARSLHSSVVLPDGKVVVVGGQVNPLPFSDDGAVLVPEAWDPATERFYPLASMAQPRTYHSVALLLPDGRVLSGGGGLCGGCSTNHPNVQIYSPPYLFNADGSAAKRPVITGAPSEGSGGANITVTTDTAVQGFVLMRMSSVTHTVNTEQRRVPLSFTQTGTNQYAVYLFSRRGVLVPGYYMLFALNSNGVPSVSRTLRVR